MNRSTLKGLMDAVTEASERRKQRSALLGDGQGNLNVTGRTGFVYARVKTPDGAESILQVRCRKTGRGLNAPVTIRRNVRDGVWETIDEDPTVAADYWSGLGGGATGSHAAMHGYFGSDMVLVDPRQIAVLRGAPTDPPSLSIEVGACLYWHNGVWSVFTGGTLDLTAQLPAAALFQRVIVVGLDGSANALATVDGVAEYRITPGASAQPFTIADVDEALAASTVPEDFIPGFAVRLFQGQTTIQKWDFFADLKALAGHSRALRLVTADVSIPPTAAELTAALGDPAETGPLLALVDDDGADTDVYLVATNGTSWWHVALTKAL